MWWLKDAEREPVELVVKSSNFKQLAHAFNLKVLSQKFSLGVLLRSSKWLIVEKMVNYNPKGTLTDSIHKACVFQNAFRQNHSSSKMALVGDNRFGFVNVR